VAGHLLNPVGSEFSATFVGRLVTTLIQKNWGSPWRKFRPFTQGCFVEITWI